MEFQDDDDNYPKCGFYKLGKLPRLTSMTPPDIPFNPYTKVANEFSESAYSGAMTYDEIYKWILSSMPEFIKTLKTRTDVDNMMQNKDLNKVILFSTKKDTSSLYRALASNFRFRLKFYYVKADNDELVDHYGIDTFPTLLIQRSETQWELYDNSDDWDIETLTTIVMNSASASEMYDIPMG